MAQKGKHAPNHILRRLRKERGWSLQRVADELRLLAEAQDENDIPGVNANMVGVWERGWKRPGPYYQALCANSTSVPPHNWASCARRLPQSYPCPQQSRTWNQSRLNRSHRFPTLLLRTNRPAL